MRATLLCSCGLLLESHGEKLLIDAPNGNFPPFYALPEDSVQRLAAGAGEFLGLRGMIFTHLHPDHYDAQRVETVLRAQPQLKIFLPDWNMPECVWLTIGRFRIECYRLAHTPVPQFPDAAHDVLLVSDGEKIVYLTADAAPDAENHWRLLNGRTVDASFWNSQYLSYPETRTLLQQCARQNYIYHMPEGELRASAIGRKCERNLQRYGAELPNVRVLTDYPTALEI